MKIRTMTLAGVTLVAVVALGMLGTWRLAQATEADRGRSTPRPPVQTPVTPTFTPTDIPEPTLSPTDTPAPTDTPVPKEQASLPHRLFVVVEDLVLSPGEKFTSEYVDVRGCHSPYFVERWSPGGPATAGVLQQVYSMDGLVDDFKPVDGPVGFTGNDRVITNFNSWPFIRFTQTNGTGVQQTFTAFIYCYPSERAGK